MTIFLLQLHFDKLIANAHSKRLEDMRMLLRGSMRSRRTSSSLWSCAWQVSIDGQFDISPT